MVALDIPLFYYCIGKASLNNEEPNKSEQENGDKSSDEIDETIFDQYLRKLDDEKLTEEELKALPKDIRESLEFKLEGKLREVLNCKSGDEITFYSYPSSYLNGGSTEGIHVVYKIEDRYGNELKPNEADYKEEETFLFEKRESTIDENTAGVIVNIDIMSDLEKQGENDEEIDKEDWIKKCKRAAEKGKNLTKSDMKKDENGNITTTKPKDEKAKGDATNDAKTTYVSRDDDDAR